MDRMKMNKKELFEECDKRGIGYMSNWTKPMLLNRLEEEDEKDAEVKRPLNIWKDIHIKKNNKKAELKWAEEKMSKIIENKRQLHKQIQEVKAEIDEIESSIKLLVKTGMFSYEERDGMMRTKMFPKEK